MKIFTFRRGRKFSFAAALNRVINTLSTVACSGLIAAFCAAPAIADDAGEVTHLLRAKQYGEALEKADAFLGKNPRDAQMRFLKGIILTEQNKAPEAIAVFSKLTEDFPALPEPYNNLAVLYAGAGQYEKARAALDAAIRTNPAYATAYENLGDVHAKLASQAYDKALQLDSGNSAAKSKLTLVRTLTGHGVGETAAAPAAARAAPQTAQAPPPAAVAPPAPAPAAPAPSAPVAAAKPEPAEREAAPVAGGTADSDEVLNAVYGWAKAWSARDVQAYLGYYSSDFALPKGKSRKAWEQERRAVIVNKSRIEVKVEQPQVEVKGDSATVKFNQVYLSDRLTANGRKVLVMAKRGGKWQIKQELAGK